MKDNISILPEKYANNSQIPSIFNCNDCILRKIAILIAAKRIQATEFRTEKNEDLFGNLTKQQNLLRINKHGQDWHRKMMSVVSEYFQRDNYKVFLEPSLNYGRADLGIYNEFNKPLYIEIGTLSLFKLWYNLSTMKNATLLLVPTEKQVIEFKLN